MSHMAKLRRFSRYSSLDLNYPQAVSPNSAK
jgi:hypothetical protein